MARWYVDLIGVRLHRLGTVVADSEKQAIAAAIKQFAIGPTRQDKIAATKISDQND